MNETAQQMLQWIPHLAGHKVLVIGDLFLDEYTIGQAARLSREAPIPVLEFARKVHLPGGAGNPAHNICALGGQATAIGLIGQDDAGELLLSELRRAGVDPAGVFVDESRPTTTKTRIMAEAPLRFPQQLARIDRLDRTPMSPAVEAELVTLTETLASCADAILVSDYQTGVASEAVVRAARDSAKAHARLCAVDAQGSFPKYVGFDLVKGNRHEMEATLGRPLLDEEDYRLAGERLLDALDAQIVLITRGAEGISVVARSEGYCHLLAANRSEVFDVTGAGDTVVATATLALVAGADAISAARLANYAAGWVIRKLGNAVVTAQDLTWAVNNW